jgi:hypothetical protein
LRIVFQLSADFPYAFLQQNAARMLEVTMSKAKRSSAILIAAGLFTTPALAAGSDVARYPTAEAYKNYETTDACTSAVLNKRDGVGIRAPRVHFRLAHAAKKRSIEEDRRTDVGSGLPTASRLFRNAYQPQPSERLSS